MNFKKTLFASSITAASMALTPLAVNALLIDGTTFQSSVFLDGTGLTIINNGGIDLSSASFTSEAVSVNSPVTADITIDAGSFINAIDPTTNSTTPIGINIFSALTGTITNNGTITAEEPAIDIPGGSLIGDIVNGATGTIQATAETAILIEFGGSMTGDITNAAGGVIEGALAGIEVIDGSDFTGNITNLGTITGMGDDFAAIEISSDVSDAVVQLTTFTGNINNTGIIQNTATSVQPGLSSNGISLFAVTLDGSINNNAGGSISSAERTGITVRGFEFTDTGITAPAAGITGSITNSGTISGAVGVQVSAATVGGVNNNAGGVINGTVVGVGIDNVRLIVDFSGSTTGGFVEDATLNNITGSFTNNGTISTSINAASLTALSLADPEAVGALYIGRSANVVGDIVNGGTGTISSVGTNAVSIGNSSGGAATVGGDLNNSGDIISTEATAVLLNGSTLGGTIINAAGATIDGADGGVLIFNSTVTGGLTNAGSIDSLGPDGPNINNAYAIDIQNSSIGAINNAATGVITGGFILEQSTITGDFTNAGTLQSAAAGGDAYVMRGVNSTQGDLINSGTISAAGTNAGVIAEQGAVLANIINSGTINAGAAAIAVNDGGSQIGTITNSVGGVLTGGSFGVISALNGGTIGSVINDGTINGLTDFGAGGGDFANSGSAGAVVGADSVTNSGTLGDVVLVAAGGSFNSTAGTVGNVSNVLGDVTNGGALGNLTFTGAGGDLTNTGTTGDVAGVTGVTTSGNMGNVQFAPGGGDFVSSAGSVGSVSGVSLVDNGGTIVGINFVTGGGMLVNSGTVSSDIIEALSVVNDGTLDDVTFVAAGGTFASGGGTVGNVSNVIGSAVNAGSVGDINFVDAVGNSFFSTGDAGNIANVDLVSNFGSLGNVTFRTMGTGVYTTVGNTSVGTIAGAQGIQVLMDPQSTGGVTTATVNGDLTFSGLLTVQAASMGAGINDYSRLAVTGNANVTGTTVFVLANGIDMFAQGDGFDFLTAGGTLTSDISAFAACDFEIDSACDSPLMSVTSNSTVLNFNVVQNGNTLSAVIGDVNFIPTVPTTTTGTTGTKNTTSVANVLISLATPNSPNAPGPGFGATELGAAINNLVQLSTVNTPEGQAAYARAIASMDAETVEGGSLSALQADTVAAATIDNRTAALRGYYGFSGAMAGDPLAINGFWLQGYGNETDQGVRDGVDGFDADTYGVGIGADVPLGERVVLGAAFSYADTDVNMKLENRNQMIIDSYRLSVYGSYNADTFYLDGQLAYAMNEYDTERAISPLLTVTPLIAKGQHDGDQYNMRVRGGYPIATDSGWFVTPTAEMNYTFLSEDSYTERGAGNLGLQLAADDVEVLVLSVGVKLAYPITTKNEVTWIPELNLNYAYDTIGDEVEVDSNFVGVTGAAFITNGANVEQQALKASFKIRAFSQGNFSFAAGYDYVDKQDYDSQSLTATVRYDF